MNFAYFLSKKHITYEKLCLQGYSGEPGDAGPPGDDANLIPVRKITFFLPLNFLNILSYLKIFLISLAASINRAKGSKRCTWTSWRKC